MDYCRAVIIWQPYLTEASTSLPFMKMVTLRVLDFAITDVLAKMVQTSVTGWDEESRSRGFWLRLCYHDVRDND